MHPVTSLIFRSSSLWFLTLLTGLLVTVFSHWYPTNSIFWSFIGLPSLMLFVSVFAVWRERFQASTERTVSELEVAQSDSTSHDDSTNNRNPKDDPVFIETLEETPKPLLFQPIESLFKPNTAKPTGNRKTDSDKKLNPPSSSVRCYLRFCQQRQNLRNSTESDQRSTTDKNSTSGNEATPDNQHAA